MIQSHSKPFGHLSISFATESFG